MSILKDLASHYLVKKANPYHAANGQFTSENGGGDKAPVHISKPKEHHSEKVKAKFAEARASKAKELGYKRRWLQNQKKVAQREASISEEDRLKEEKRVKSRNKWLNKEIRRVTKT